MIAFHLNGRSGVSPYLQVVQQVRQALRDLLRRGTVLVDERDATTQPRVLFFMEHAVQDAGVTRSGERRTVSKRLLFVEIDRTGTARHLSYAPYLDYRPLQAGEPDVVSGYADERSSAMASTVEGQP